VTAAADGEPFLRCNREELHPYDEYTLAQHKVSSQLRIPLQNSQRTTLLRYSKAVHFTLTHVQILNR